MNAEYVRLSEGQVALAALLIVINGVISLSLKLGLEWRLMVAAMRMVAQLGLIGLVLRWVFALEHVAVIMTLALVMTIVAGLAAVQRTERRFPGVWINSVISVWASSWLITAVAVSGVVQIEPWYKPQYAIPLLGMILGNTLTGISLGLDRLSDELMRRRDQVEMMLTLGATRWEAARPSLRTAIRTGMIPILNTMAVAGIVSLPGMMTGQLLAGVEPIQAVKYQIVIMFLIASATALGTVGVVLLGYRRLFNADHQFRFERIQKR